VREAATHAYEQEVDALAAGGVHLRRLIDGRWVGPPWVKEILNEGLAVWDRTELTAIAMAVQGGVDPDALCAAYRLGGKYAALELIGIEDL
jgi:hypothetical protein